MNSPRGPKSDKIWADAVRKAVHEYRACATQSGAVEKIRAINLLAKNLVTKGIEGDVAALREIGDRLDGKPRQTIAGDGEGGALTVQIVKYHNASE